MKQIGRYVRAFIVVLRSIYFNFHYLPINQAIKLPILAYNVHGVSMKGKVIIDCENVTFGMIELGKYRCKAYPNDGVVWDNRGGTAVFKGKAHIGNHSFVIIGRKSTVEFGDDFRSNAGLKLVSFFGMKFGVTTIFGWDCLIMDTNMHPLYDMEKKQFKRASGRIEIGDYNWFGTGCRIMHSTVTPERCIFGMNTTVTRNCVKESYCVMGGYPVRVLTRNVMRIIGQDLEDLN